MSENAQRGKRRGAMFFETDVLSAADTAAYGLEEHGLSPEQVTALSELAEVKSND